ncbi:hypothetical protein HPB49_014221 [Dermacentor silvarum]|uniref:Uncharacterized protein n=1 Tax=Dermacentor silvarum TaxID=543639 RepID=A0ACB8C447_DERSI|nr:hypothetical protein HPB49_014221 [Dermacentor silvarum]
MVHHRHIVSFRDRAVKNVRNQYIVSDCPVPVSGEPAFEAYQWAKTIFGNASPHAYTSAPARRDPLQLKEREIITKFTIVSEWDVLGMDTSLTE